ncbi:MAG TPA: hypothetical protein VLV28_01645 [Gaiellaceae bacterium]|nr:hypothetical protein [Gaiellaceae bacterium]
MSLGGLLFLVFTATFVARMRASREGFTDEASALLLLGSGVLVTGMLALAGLSITLADVSGHVSGAALQTLNVFANDAVFVFLLTIGTSVFLIGAAIAVFVAPLLPRWLGWFAIVLAVVGAIPSHVLGGTLDHIGFVAFAGLCLWTLVLCGLLALRPGES